MKINIEILQIRLNGRSLGRLAMGKDGKSRFEYDSEWLRTGYSVSPFYLPLKAGVFVAKHEPFDGVFGVFADSMPDEWGNLLLDRFLQSNQVLLSSLSPLDRLAFVGNNGMGALSYEPDNSLMYRQQISKLYEIANQVAEILSEQADLPTVTALLEQTGSSGGARPKVIIRHKGAAWLVKFASSNDPSNIGEQEFFYSQLARQCGIEMAETQLFENKFFGTRLFDRTADERFHVHSASGLLHASHRFPSLDYRQLAQATMAVTQNVQELTKLLILMVFNVRIKNKDDHAKNFSFMKRNNAWQLSPAYDLVKSKGFGNQHATAVLGVGNPNRNDMMRLAKEINYPTKKMTQIIDKVFDICNSFSL